MKFKNVFLSFLLVALVLGTDVARAANGCEDDDNDMIAAELALCSTHAYNIGETQNPDGDERELMNDVIAMKTTLITQQMFSQYTQMQSMLRRLRTQLQKAVTTTSLQAAGAKAKTVDESEESSGFKSTNRNIHMEDAKDCNQELTDIKVLECLQENMKLIYDASGNGSSPSPEARKQLASDYSVLKNLNIKDSNDGNASCVGDVEEYCTDKDGKLMNNKKRFTECLDGFRNALRRCYGGVQAEERKNQASLNPWGMMRQQ